jgi:hypothetical protein
MGAGCRPARSQVPRVMRFASIGLTWHRIDRKERSMFGKLNHLAITSDHYTLLGMLYRATFGLQASGDTAREIGAISVGDNFSLPIPMER